MIYTFFFSFFFFYLTEQSFSQSFYIENSFSVIALLCYLAKNVVYLQSELWISYFPPISFITLTRIIDELQRTFYDTVMIKSQSKIYKTLSVSVLGKIFYERIYIRKRAMYAIEIFLFLRIKKTKCILYEILLVLREKIIYQFSFQIN